MYFQIGDIRCYAEVLGHGPALLCVHGGFGLDHTYFRPYLDQLSADFQLILLDVRGHGRGDPLPGRTFRFEAIMGDLEAIRQQLGIAQWALLGHSGGGILTGQYAANFPQHVSHLIFVCSFPHYPFEAPEWLPMARAAHDPGIWEGIQAFLRGVRTDDDYRRAFLQIAPLFFADPAHADLRAFENITYRAAQYLEVMKHYEKYDIGPQLATCIKPALVIHGAKDYRTPPAEGKRWLRYLPHAQYHEIPDTGHFPFVEQPDTVCELIRGFLGA